MYTMYQIILEDTYDGTRKSFTRIFPNKIGDLQIEIMEIFQIIDAEINEPLRQKQFPAKSISITTLSPLDYPRGHWYRESMTTNYTSEIY